jgi:hypothetical protein
MPNFPLCPTGFRERSKRPLPYWLEGVRIIPNSFSIAGDKNQIQRALTRVCRRGPIPRLGSFP